MAVEIPVVIDIDKAFADAVKKIPAAIKPLKDSIGKLTEDLSVWREKLEKYKIDGSQWKNAAKNFQAVSQAIEVASDKLSFFSSNEGSIKRMNAELSSLTRRWEEMGESQKFLKNGELSADAEHLYEQYKKVIAQIEQFGKSLSQMHAEEKMALKEAERAAQEKANAEKKAAEEEMRAQKKLDDLRRRGAQSRQYENAILNSTVKTMRILQEQERILSSRLSTATIGSNKYKELKTQLEAVRSEIKKINTDVSEKTNPALKTADSRLVSLIKNSLRLVALHTGMRFVRNIREVTAEFELQRVALGAIIKDTDLADMLFRQIKAAAVESPFEIKDLVSYTKQLAAYQIETEKLFDTTKKLADISAGLGVDMGRLILAYGQVRAASVLRGQELRQFTEAGIPLVEKLAEKFRELGREGTTTADVFQLISERAVPFEMIDEIFDDMTKSGGMFYKMQEKQAKTLAGQWANLKDAVSIMYDEIGNTKSVHNAMESVISMARTLMQHWRDIANVIKIVGGSLLVYYGNVLKIIAVTKLQAIAEREVVAAETARERSMKRLILQIFGKTAATKIDTLATKAYSAAMDKAAAATTLLGKAFWKLAASLAVNPFGAIAIAIGAITAGIVSLVTKSVDVEERLSSAAKTAERLNNTRTETAKLISEYDELSKKIDLTAEEAKKLKNVSRELADIFPKTVKGIDNQTGALKLNIEKLKQYNAETQKAIEKGARAEIRENERAIERMEKQVEKTQRTINRGWAKYGPTKTLFSIVQLPLTAEETRKRKDKILELQEQIDALRKSNQELQDGLDGVVRKADGTIQEVTKWQEKLIEFNAKATASGAAINVLLKTEIMGYTSLDAALEELAKRYSDEAKRVELLTKALEGRNAEEAKSIQISLDLAIARRDAAKEQLDYYNAFYLTQKAATTSTQKDPFVTQMQERIKFMQDFRKGYDELRRYMSSAKALTEETDIMIGRGTSLGLKTSDQTRAATDLSGWYSDMIEMVKKRMKDRGAKGVTVNDLLGLQISDANKQLKDLQSLLQSLWDAKTDYDTKKKADELEDALKKVAIAVKESETARNFYQDILDLTGDTDLAATMTVSVYGGIGEDFKERMQHQLNAALESLDPDKVTDDLRAAFREMDYKKILENIDLFGEKWQEQLRQMAEDQQMYSADQIKTWLDELKKAKTYGEQRAEIAQKTAQKIAEINASSLPEDQKLNLSAQYARKEAEEVAKLQYDVFKESPMYVNLFANLDEASSKMLSNMRNSLIALKEHWKDLRPAEVKELQARIEELDNQLASRNPFKTLVDTLRQYREMRQEGRSREEDESNAVAANQNRVLQQQILEERIQNLKVAQETYGVDSEQYKLAKSALKAQQQKTDQAIAEADAAEQTADEWRNTAHQIQIAAEKMQEYAGYVNDSLGAISQIVGTFASDDTTEYFDTLVNGIGQTISGTATMATSLAKIITTGGTAQDYVNVIKGTADVIQGIFGTKKQLQIQRLNKEIENQQTRIESLDRAVEHLSDSMNKAFGSDYVHAYTQQLDAILAKQKAYEEQARLEREKGKKADEEKIRGYEESAADVANEILNMQGQLSEFFAGTDVASAARDFATAWIDAYKEFGSTTDAMKQKFNDMMQDMVTSAIGAKIMETILTPLFQQIEQMAQTDGALSVEEIAEIGKMAPKYIEEMNLGMSGLMTSLAAAGYNVRQQVGGLSGISKQIAGASEESILGLAAGINTQNFYMSYMPTISENVAQILTVLSPDGARPAYASTEYASAGAPGMPSVQELVNTHLPDMDYNLSEVLRLLSSVIKPNGATASHYVSAKM